jgi:hypothetical protein
MQFIRHCSANINSIREKNCAGLLEWLSMCVHCLSEKKMYFSDTGGKMYSKTVHLLFVDGMSGYPIFVNSVTASYFIQVTFIFYII